MNHRVPSFVNSAELTFPDGRSLSRMLTTPAFFRLSRIRACCETSSLGRLMLWASRASLRTTLLKRCRPCSDLLKVSEAMVEPAKGCGSNFEIATAFHNRSLCGDSRFTDATVRFNGG
jgi:hypothetical protein